MKKILVLVLALLCLAALVFAGGQGDKAKAAAGGVRTTAPRADATPGASITPTDFPPEVLPGLAKIGAVPKKKYKIAFSNGDMGNVWRRTFWEDMEDYAKQYKERFGIEFIEANAGNNTTKQLQDSTSLIAQ